MVLTWCRWSIVGPHFTDRGYNAFMLQAVSNFYMRHVRVCARVVYLWRAWHSLLGLMPDCHCHVHAFRSAPPDQCERYPPTPECRSPF